MFYCFLKAQSRMGRLNATVLALTLLCGIVSSAASDDIRAADVEARSINCSEKDQEHWIPHESAGLKFVDHVGHLTRSAEVIPVLLALKVSSTPKMRKRLHSFFAKAFPLLSVACSDCFEANAICAAKKCAGKCAMDHTSEACLQCNEKWCLEAFKACSGIHDMTLLPPRPIKKGAKPDDIHNPIAAETPISHADQSDHQETLLEP